ncbi:NUDIX hydrolase [Tuberibacillus sp. Marseille-P3662]|uniref:NUDIX hydrolase n=1 Tax=Tuberibacillus sp. Marseille-P3662 TaxID=1965358 RepID=UPI000A1CBB2D|nr:NUDIX hydrolase [Tuberibacillus sp. Marseille-P3662]
MDAVFETEQSIFNYRVAGVWIEGDHVLLHKAVDDDHWALPGGRVKIAEESETSIKREMVEELGIEVKVNHTIWIIENFFNFGSRDYHEIGFYYNISPVDRSSHLTTDAFYGLEGERLIYQWVPIEELNNLILYPVFLTAALKDIPTHTEHLVVRQ